MSSETVSVVLDDASWPAQVIGSLSHDRRGSSDVIRFAYSTAWLESADAFAIDPQLPLYSGDQFPAGLALFGIFRDTSPDRWGRILMERREALEARAEDRRPRRLGAWELLVGVSDTTRMGALRLREQSGEQKFLDHRSLGVPPAAQLRELEAIARALDEPDSEERPEYEAWLKQLIAPGSSLGGGRPKATFSEPDGTLWIAKFPGSQDRFDVGSWEFLAHELAVRARIQVPEARQLELGADHHTFAVRRFDREGGRRRLYASATTLLALEDGDASSYLEIARALQDQGDPDAIASDLAELYRRVIFNVVVGNRDDHLRNHGFLRGKQGWTLAPAFDINPNPDKDEHVLALDEASVIPSIDAVRKTRELYRLSASAASEIEKQVRAAFHDWKSLAASLGIARSEIQRLDTIIAPN